MSEEISDVPNVEGAQASSVEDSQPLSVMRRKINALRALTATLEEMDAEQRKQIHILELEHDRLRQVIFERRSSILSGEHEPTEEESKYPSDDGKEPDIYRCFAQLDETTKGVPKFWLTVLKSSKKTAHYIQDYDEPILSHLQDIKVKVHENPMGFILEFYFSKNEYFTNKVLTKHYEMNNEPSKDELFSLEAPEIRAYKGCKINWKEGKNVTLHITKTVTQISGSKIKTVTNISQKDSFFEFFSLPAIPSSFLREKFEQHKLQLIIEDSHLAQHIKNKIIPKAVSYYIGGGKRREEDSKEKESTDFGEGDLSCSII